MGSASMKDSSPLQADCTRSPVPSILRVELLLQVNEQILNMSSVDFIHAFFLTICFGFSTSDVLST